MLALAVIGFILINVLGIVFLPRFTVCMYIWYTLAKWGYLTAGAPEWIVLPTVILVVSTIAVLVWDILRNMSFFDGYQKYF